MNTNGINDKTKVSFTVIGALVIPIIAAVAAFTSVRVEQKALKEKVNTIEGDYVPRSEIEVKLDSIENNINDIDKKIDRLIEK